MTRIQPRGKQMAAPNLRILNARARPTIGNDGNPPHDGDMEARVAKLEAAVEHIQRDVAEVRTSLALLNNTVSAVQTDVAVIKERLSHTPTTLQMWLALVAVVVPVGGAVVGILGWIIQSSLAPLLAKALGQ